MEIGEKEGLFMKCTRFYEKILKKEPVPEMLFKYKALTNSRDYERFEEIVKNRRLYFPNVLQLNDPFEGLLRLRVPGLMGQLYHDLNDEDHPVIISEKKKHHILSLSEDCFSAQLWAYYCLDYKGAVLCFNTGKTFENAKKVVYLDSKQILKYKNEIDKENNERQTDEEFDKALLNSLLVKEKGWQYEKEWRIVEKTENKESVKFYKKELTAAIIGHNLEESEEKAIIQMFPTGFPIFKTCPGSRSGKVHFLRYNYSGDDEGLMPDFIDTVDDLIKAINKYGHIA